MIVESPSVDLLSFVDVEGVMIPSPDVLSIASSHSLNHECLSVLVTCVQHATKLPALRITPCENLAISGKCQSMVSSGSYFS